MIPFLETFVDNPTGPHQRKLDRRLIDMYKNDLLDVVFTTFVCGAMEWYKLRQANIRLRTKLPEVAVETTKEYVLENDNVKQWMNEQCELGSTKEHEATVNDLWLSYEAWCDTYGHKSIGNRPFTKHMLHVFKKQVKIGTSRGYRGIKVLQKPDPGQF
jgi:phage/plasmid-associated DNA primase